MGTAGPAGVSQADLEVRKDKMKCVWKLSDDEIIALNALRDRLDHEIDFTDPDAPEVTDWSGARRFG